MIYSNCLLEALKAKLKENMQIDFEELQERGAYEKVE